MSHGHRDRDCCCERKCCCEPCQPQFECCNPGPIFGGLGNIGCGSGIGSGGGLWLIIIIAVFFCFCCKDRW